MEHDDTNKGVLFFNEDKKSDRYPDVSGWINLDGKKTFIIGWKKYGKKGPFLSLTKSKKQEEHKSMQPDQARFEDDVPW